MLFRIKVQKLFNIYDYDIKLNEGDNSLIRFLTAPNGYGKTTILDLVNASVNQSYGKFFQIPFDKFELYYDGSDAVDFYIYSVTRTEKRVPYDDTDIVQLIGKTLCVELQRSVNGKGECIERFSVNENSNGIISIDGTDNNVQMFFVARTCFYLTDARNLIQKKDNISEGEKTRAIEEIPINSYARELKEILNSFEKKTEYEPYVQVFREIINRCDFANKHLEIDKRFGFRFVMDDELHTILTLNQLSSGEKQMIIQVYELLFRAQSGTIVLIDEPELSLHMMWQMDYLKNLSQIANLRGFQCIVATHSPQIFSSLWTKTVDLFDILEGK